MKNLISGIIALVMIIGLQSCGIKPVTGDNRDGNIPVVTRKISRVSANKEISVSGNIEGRKTIKLGFLVSGKINYIAGDEGSTVSAGQLLASLDPENYSIAKEIAEANLDQVQDEYNRLNMMHERGSVSDGDFSKITNGLRSAKAQVKLHTKNLADTRLYCPVNGVLLKKGVETGEIIGTGIPLFVVSDISTVKVNASVPESELNKIGIGDEARVYVSALDETFTGKVIEVGSLAESTTRTFSVKVELKNPRLTIRPGMTAEVKFISGDKKEVLAIQGDAIMHDVDNSSYVFVVDEAKKQVFKRIVTIGRLIGNDIEITSGLNENEIVVTGGQNKLKDGSSVTISKND
ncbi:MAG: efflux RND transporter periplasmic adaptor subunit [Bacteroidetes bacterium]|nr:efflux RND transporter periplasmic adaptor subunit [Bacteroidota bacterium]